jgi:hypothetical protein
MRVPNRRRSSGMMKLLNVVNAARGQPNGVSSETASGGQSGSALRNVASMAVTSARANRRPSLASLAGEGLSASVRSLYSDAATATVARDGNGIFRAGGKATSGCVCLCAWGGYVWRLCVVARVTVRRLWMFRLCVLMCYLLCVCVDVLAP